MEKLSKKIAAQLIQAEANMRNNEQTFKETEQKLIELELKIKKLKEQEAETKRLIQEALTD